MVPKILNPNDRVFQYKRIDLTRMAFNIHVSTNILLVIIYVFSKKMEAFSPALLFSFWALTRIGFNTRISNNSPFLAL